jgi:hypothetical protein
MDRGLIAKWGPATPKRRVGRALDRAAGGAADRAVGIWILGAVVGIATWASIYDGFTLCTAARVGRSS